MTTTSQIPITIRNTFKRIPVVDEHRQLFSEPTSPLLGFDGEERVESLRRFGTKTTSTVNLHPAFRFMVEAQLEALEDLFIYLGEKNPERFRETERGFDLIKNLEILLNGPQSDDCGPEGA